MCQSQERKPMKGLGERHPKLTMKVSPRCAQKRWRARSWYVRHTLVAASPVSPLPPRAHNPNSHGPAQSGIDLRIIIIGFGFPHNWKRV